MFKLNTAIILGVGLAVSASTTYAHDSDSIYEATIDVISNDQDPMDIDIPTISLETEPESEALSDSTQQRIEEQERAIEDSANFEAGLAAMLEIRNENREEQCNDLRVDTQLQHVLHETM